MNDEIKEILEALKLHDKEFAKAGIKEYSLVLSVKEQKILLDYITKLQQENEHLDKVNCQLRKKINNDIYKSRVKKAVEYNYELQERYCHSALFDELVASKVYEISEKNLNILQGESHEE